VYKCNLKDLIVHIIAYILSYQFIKHSSRSNNYYKY